MYIGEYILAKQKKKTDEASLTKQKTATGISISAGEIIHSDYDSKSWTELQQDYSNMMNGCPVISATFKLISYPLLAAKYVLETESKNPRENKCIDMVNWNLDSLYKNLRYFRKHQIDAIWTGVAIFEKIIKKADEYIFIEDEKSHRKI